MLARQTVLKCKVRTFIEPLCGHRTFSSSRRTGIKYLQCRFSERIKFERYITNNQTKPSSKSKFVPVLLGIAGAGGVAVYAYTRFSSEPHPPDSDDDEPFDEAPYVHKNLQQDLALLKEFGPVPYLLVGAGSASFTAFRAIRTKDPTAKVLMIGEEAFLPYMRPPLSKEMWFDEKGEGAKTLTFKQWNDKERSIFYEHEDYYFTISELLENKNGGVSVIRGKKVVKVDPSLQVVYLDGGEKISYDKCLLATGARPKNLPIFEEADDSVKKHVSLFRTVRDFQKLDRISKKVKSVAIVGGGFLGSELACGLAKRGSSSGLEVTQIFPESGNMGKVLPEYLSKWTMKKLQKEGVKIIPDVTVQSVSLKDKKIELHLSDDKVILADHVVVAVGAEPNTDIAKASGLEVDEHHGGFLVNAEMEARKNLWIAGDASCFYDVKLGRRRVEHHDHAVVSGRLAGENMTSNGGNPYWHQSMFWSDLGPDIGFEAIGIIDSSLPTVGVFTKATEKDNPKTVVDSTGTSIRSEAEQLTNLSAKDSLENQVPRIPEPNDDYGKGVIFYLRDNIIVGIVLWNVFSKMSIARKIINGSKSYEDLTEVAKLFELHSSD